MPSGSKPLSHADGGSDDDSTDDSKDDSRGSSDGSPEDNPKGNSEENSNMPEPPYTPNRRGPKGPPRTEEPFYRLGIATSEAVPSEATSDELKGLKGFVAKEIRRRFGPPPALPAHLMDWTDPADEEETAARGEWSHFDGEGLIHLRSRIPSEEWPDCREQLASQFCKEFGSVLEREGRVGLERLRAALRERLSDEQDRLARLRNDVAYRNLLIRLLSELPDTVDWSQEQIELPPGPQQLVIERQDIIAPFQRLVVYATAPTLRASHIDPDALSVNGVVIPDTPETLIEVEHGIRRYFAPILRAQRACEEAIMLLEYRLHLLKESLWGYDVLGVSSASVVVEAASRPTPYRNDGITKTRLQQAVLAYEVLHTYGDRPKAHPSSQRKFAAYIDDQTTAKERGVASGEAIVKGTKRLLDEGYDEPTADQDLFDSLQRRGSDIVQDAYTCGLIDQDD